MTLKKTFVGAALTGLGTITVSMSATPARAHEPIFTPGAHVSAKGGQEVALQYRRNRARGAGTKETEQELALEYAYGISSSWTVKAEIPVVDKNFTRGRSSGVGDVILGTKYRFLRIDKPGRQFSTTGLFQVKLATASDRKSPRLGSGSTDVVGGILHGLESRRWYYNTAARYRLNSEGGGGLKKGNTVLLDLVAGVRPVLTKYKEPDTVLFLELNWEKSGRDSLRGLSVADTGGWEAFITPGIFWTYRTAAVTAGIQLPLAQDLNGPQPTSDYRFKLSTKFSF